MSSARVGRVLLCAACFGVVAALVKGNGGGLRADIGNLSAPWLLVAFLAGLGHKSLGRGAVVGLASTIQALVAFYATLSAMLIGHLGPGGLIHDFVTEFAANRVYLVLGLIAGPFFGALGAWVGNDHPGRSLLWAGSIVAGEIGVVALVQGREMLPGPFYLRWAVDDWAVYVIECLVGLAAVAAAIWMRRRNTRESLLI